MIHERAHSSTPLPQVRWNWLLRTAWAVIATETVPEKSPLGAEKLTQFQAVLAI